MRLAERVTFGPADSVCSGLNDVKLIALFVRERLGSGHQNLKALRGIAREVPLVPSSGMEDLKAG